MCDAAGKGLKAISRYYPAYRMLQSKKPLLRLFRESRDYIYPARRPEQPDLSALLLSGRFSVLGADSFGAAAFLRAAAKLDE
ncbi:hypothetical protein DFR37_101549 [Eoetvoesiella caeni]|uniref:Uncharacterized protein n=1 Tax=Eoetvoesiella caeni TaxID=645616 RepID=A0A366HLG6_9BURK|nr:hypothetical protein DFR37_101549 [Eoetvoesiella caeni]